MEGRGLSRRPVTTNRELRQLPTIRARTRLPNGHNVPKAGILSSRAKLETRFGNFQKAKDLIRNDLDKMGITGGFGRKSIKLTDELVETYILSGDLDGAKSAVRGLL